MYSCIVPKNRTCCATRSFKLRLIKYTILIGGEMCDVMDDVSLKPTVLKSEQYIIVELSNFILRQEKGCPSDNTFSCLSLILGIANSCFSINLNLCYPLFIVPPTCRCIVPNKRTCCAFLKVNAGRLDEFDWRKKVWRNGWRMHKTNCFKKWTIINTWWRNYDIIKYIGSEVQINIF